MKINWGTGLVIAMILFIGFIMFFVISISTNEDLDHDLVTPDYYNKELHYQEEIDAESNLKELSSTINGEKVEGGWLLTFPKEIDPSKIKGTVYLYRPSNKKLDFDLPIVLSGLKLLIPDDRLVEGRWNIALDWEYKNKRYLYKNAITY